MAPGRWFPLLSLLVGCDLGGDVAHDGQYGFLPTAGLPGTGARPLERLLVLEADGAADRTLIYYFQGDLGRAGIGVEDLRDISRRFSRFEMRFDFPPAAYPLSPSGTDGQGGEGGATDGPSEPEPVRDTVALRIDDEPELALSELDSAELATTGATRFAPAIDAARAYFGIRRSSADFVALELDSSPGTLVYEPELAPSRLEIERSDSELRVEYGDLRRPDYVEIDFFQPLLRLADERELDGSARILLWPEWPAVASNEVLESAASQGCWLTDSPLSVRATQVARSYRADGNSDSAIVFRRLDTEELPPESWSEGLEPVEPLPYCDGFQIP